MCDRWNSILITWTNVADPVEASAVSVRIVKDGIELAIDSFQLEQFVLNF